MYAEKQSTWRNFIMHKKKETLGLFWINQVELGIKWMRRIKEENVEANSYYSWQWE